VFPTMQIASCVSGTPEYLWEISIITTTIGTYSSMCTIIIMVREYHGTIIMVIIKHRKQKTHRDWSVGRVVSATEGRLIIRTTYHLPGWVCHTGYVLSWLAWLAGELTATLLSWDGSSLASYATASTEKKSLLQPPSA
jgi:hypothetical protein